MAMKTVAAFLNSNGGHLVIGAGDDRNVLGLSADYKTLGRPTSDGFENYFTQLFNKMIGANLRHLVRLNFETLGGEEMKCVCVCGVRVSKRVSGISHHRQRRIFLRPHGERLHPALLKRSGTVHPLPLAPASGNELIFSL